MTCVNEFEGGEWGRRRTYVSITCYIDVRVHFESEER